MTKMSNTEEQDKGSAQQVSTVAKRRNFLKKANRRGSGDVYIYTNEMI